MPDIFLTLALVILVVCALLYFAPRLKLLNFVDYRNDADVMRVNRCAAVRLLFPVLVNVVCSYIAKSQPGLKVPLFFLTPLSILLTSIWINAQVSRFRTGKEKSEPFNRAE